MVNSDMPSHHGIKYLPDEDAARLNETMRLLCERGSCRNFTSQPLTEDALEALLTAGVHAATGGNLQPYSIIVIKDKERREKLAEMCFQSYMATAPIHLLFCIDFHRLERWARLKLAPFAANHAFRHFWISFQDTIITAQSICTAADSLGMGSVYIGTIMEYITECREMFKLPQGVLPVVLLCVGYPASHPAPRRKLSPDVVTHREEYRELSDESLIEAFDAKYEGLKVEITEERKEALFEECRVLNGEEYAKKALEEVNRVGYINPVQRYFGLHYAATGMFDGNDLFIKAIRECGFDWFEEFIPSP